MRGFLCGGRQVAFGAVMASLLCCGGQKIEVKV